MRLALNSSILALLSKSNLYHALKVICHSVNELESVILYVIEETVMDDFKEP